MTKRMLEEIFQYPEAIDRTTQSFAKCAKELLEKMGARKSRIKRVEFIACGTSFYAGALAKYYWEQRLEIPVALELAHEYMDRPSIADPTTLVIGLSQSGTSADTIGAMKAAKARGAATASIVNVPDSTMCHESDVFFVTLAGVEKSIPSTKVFAAQVTALVLFADALAEAVLSSDTFLKMSAVCTTKMEWLSQEIRSLATSLSKEERVIFLGAGPCFPIALEAALKTKETSYICADAYAAGEIRHGPVATVVPRQIVVCFLRNDSHRDRMISVMGDLKKLGARILCFDAGNGQGADSLAEKLISFSSSLGFADTVLLSLSAHLFSFWFAFGKGMPIDAPRNLVKSVTRDTLL